MPVAVPGRLSVKLRVVLLTVNFSPTHTWPVRNTFVLSLFTTATAV